MTCNNEGSGEEKRRRGPSNLTISWGMVISVLTLAASGVATYNTIQNDIAGIKRGEQYQEQTNQRLSDDIKSVRQEQRESMKDLGEKIDRIAEHLSRRR